MQCCRSVTILLALALLPTGMARAQDAPADARADAMIARQKQVYGPPPPRPRCGARSTEGEIVVCAPDDGAQYRVPSSRESNPTSREALYDGLPRAPDVAGGGIFKGPPTIGGLCVLPPCPPPPVYMIDLKSIPEAPAGSDAEKVAKGEMRDR